MPSSLTLTKNLQKILSSNCYDQKCPLCEAFPSIHRHQNGAVGLGGGGGVEGKSLEKRRPMVVGAGPICRLKQDKD